MDKPTIIKRYSYTLLSEADKSGQQKIITDTKFSTINKLAIKLTFQLGFCSSSVTLFFKKILLKYTLLRVKCTDLNCTVWCTREMYTYMQQSSQFILEDFHYQRVLLWFFLISFQTLPSRGNPDLISFTEDEFFFLFLNFM